MINDTRVAPAEPDVSVLLIDDDEELCDLMREFFAERGVAVEAMHDGRRGLSRALADEHDLILLDVMLPGLEGFEVLRQLRRRSAVPIIMLTARTARADRVAGLDAGADDYLPKPFEPEELIARIRAVLRRAGRAAAAGPEALVVNGVRLVTGTREVWCDGTPLEITTTEFDILELLLRSAGRIISRTEMSAAIYRRPVSAKDRSLDVHVSHLRKKLGSAGGLIRTIRGVGYLFCAEVGEPKGPEHEDPVRSIFTKIVFWFTATIVLSLVGYVATSMLLFARLAAREPMIPGMHWHLLEDARDAYEKGGAPRLAEYLAQLNSYTRTERFLVDSHGRDLVTGEDRSGLLAQRAPRTRGRRWLPGMPRGAWFVGWEGPMILAHSSSDRRYRLISVLHGRSRSEALESLAYFLWLPLLIGVFCYVLAVHLASPLRGLRRAMEKFGRGDLGIRYHLSRRDEIGEVAQAFNRMADQITTLLAAERRLLQDVSHELRSPLARLGFAVELARTSPDREAALNRIRKEADRLSNLVDELLQLTRAEGDPGARNLEDVDLARLLGELVTDCALEADAAGCWLALNGERSVVVTGDRELLRRACDNVLRNAIRHAPPGSAVEIKLARRDGRAEIDVRDHGTGVPRDTLGAIFEPFFRVESDRGRSSGGVGLGLAIARRAVELHQGQITAYNADPGLVVAIELPCRDEPGPGTARQPGAADRAARA